MTDFLLAFGQKYDIRYDSLTRFMQYFSDIEVQTFKHDNYCIILSRPDDWSMWGPFISEENKIRVYLAGRIALEEREWENASNIKGEGGTACKAIFEMYRRGGIPLLKKLNGNFVALICDDNARRFYLITDRCGMFPCYSSGLNENDFIISSHPDLLAKALNNSCEWDMTSLAEFLATGKVSFPHTYYKNIKALDYGSIHIIDLQTNDATYNSKIKYFDFDYQIDHQLTEWELAEELASSFRKAINRRTLSRFGITGISLSAGLDSRSFLCAANSKENIISFCFFDEENLEYQIAQKIADTAGVKLYKLKRQFDHYGNHADLGTTISGGMGDFGSNHYLGFRNEFKKLRIENIIAGFYCDYLFKSLVLNKKRNLLSRREKYSEFQYDNYMRTYLFDTPYSDQVKERIDAMFPDHIKKDESELGRLKIEQRRLFPLHSEPDNQETLVPQRVLGWFLPIVDNDIIDTYLRIPPKYKLNVSMYSKMVQLLCGKEISNITNSNTGAKVNASIVSMIIHGYVKSFKTRLRKKRRTIVTEESWPNWEYYISNSKIIESLWMSKDEKSAEIFRLITGTDPYRTRIQHHAVGVNLKLFLRLLTLKLWMDSAQSNNNDGTALWKMKSIQVK
jgi:hypothetical protein